MNDKQVPANRNLHALISQFRKQKKVPDKIVAQEVLRITEARKTSQQT